MSKSKNNFQNPSIKAKCLWRLWVVYDPQSVIGKKYPKFKYFGHMSKPNGGRDSLEKLVVGRFDIIKYAALYNSENKIEKEWKNEKFLTPAGQ